MLNQDKHNVIIKLLQDYVVKETTGNDMNKNKMRRLFYSKMDQVVNKIDMRLATKIQNYMLLSLLLNLKIAIF